MSETAPKDVLVRSAELPWIPMEPGTWFKLLRLSPETGVWSALVRMEPGASFGPHKHLGPAEFFVLQGALHYRGGIAREGDYGYEPIGVEHHATTCKEETLFTFTVHGPMAYLAPDGSIAWVLDAAFIQRHVDEHLAKQGRGSEEAA
jgi:quercetin dioxygenase-like cupin family protein